MKRSNHFVFLSGWGFRPQLFSSFAKQLPGDATFLEFPSLRSVDSIDNAIDQLLCSIPSKSIIIGWSLGGLIALKLSVLFPNTCQRLILMATTPKFAQTQDWQGIDSTKINYFLNHFRSHFIDLMNYFIKLINYPNKNKHIKQLIKDYHVSAADRYNKESLFRYLELLFYTDLRDAYAMLTIPTLHLLGGNEGIIVCNDTQLKRLNSNVNITTIKQSGHAPFLTHSNECLKHIKTFLSQDFV
jgi:pimeloyl-[acyl-carrier protein] methyl ester esterase